MDAQVPNRAPPKGKSKGKDKSKDDSATPVPEGLAFHAPIFFPENLYLQPEIPLYSPQQHWEDLAKRHLLPPDFRDHNKIRCAYNTDSIQYLYDGNIRHPTPKGQNPTQAGILDFPSVIRKTRIAEAETAACLNTSSILPVFALGAGPVEHKRRAHTRSIRKMGCRTDVDHEVQRHPFQQGRKSLSLLQTAYGVAQPLSLRKQGLFRGKQLPICTL